MTEKVDNVKALTVKHETITQWEKYDFKSAVRIVEQLRKRIFRATRENNIKKVRGLQKLMLRSRANVLDSVQRRISKITAQNRLTKFKCTVMSRQHYCCPVCTRDLVLGDKIEETDLHHIIPVKDGGGDGKENLVYLHKSCHKIVHSLGANTPEGLKAMGLNLEILNRLKGINLKWWKQQEKNKKAKGLLQTS